LANPIVAYTSRNYGKCDVHLLNMGLCLLLLELLAAL
jgi:hypothetical protein